MIKFLLSDNMNYRQYELQTIIFAFPERGVIVQLEALKKVKTYEMVAKTLKEYIAANKLKSGDLLPSEFELTRILNVSRSSVREGIRYLQTLGLVESHVKKGLVIKEANLEPMKDYIQFQLQNNNICYQKLYEATTVIYLGILPIIIFKLTDDHFEILEGIIKKQEENIKNRKTFREYNYLFHETLIEITDNDVIKQFTKILKLSFENKPSEFNDEIALTTINMHRDILQQLKSRDIDKALGAMLRHDHFYEKVKIFLRKAD